MSRTFSRIGRLALSLVMAAATLPVAGCWNSRELDKLAIVTAMAIDRVPETGEYDLAFQVVIPSQMTHSSNGGGEMPFAIYGIRAPTLFEGIRKASKEVPRQLFFSHIQIVVLGEKLAESGITEIFDFFERSHEVRLTSMLLVGRGTPPDKLISALMPVERLQATAVLEEAKLTSRIWSETVPVEIDDVIRKLINKGAEPTIGGLKLIGNSKAAMQKKSMESSRPPYHLEVEDIAMFREGKLVGWLEKEAARGYLFVANKVRSSIINLPCEDRPDGVALEIIQSKTDTGVAMKDGRLRVNVVVSSEASVGEVKCGIALEKLEVTRQLEREWEEAVRSNIESAVAQAQALKTDIFGFGVELQRSHPKQWKKAEKEWDEVFAAAEIDVKFHGAIRRAGMRGKSLLETS